MMRRPWTIKSRSGLPIYKVSVTIEAAPQTQWRSLCSDCAGSIDSLVELLQGCFSKGVMERLCRQDGGLFPNPSEINFSCSCPDYASMCKHIAAVLYGIGARLDAQPELLFRLRAVDEADLVANLGSGLPLSKQAPAAGKVLKADDLSTMFGLDMAEGETLMPQKDDMWRQIEDLISLRNSPGYDKAATLLRDLRDTARKDRKMRDFNRRLAVLRDRHERKGKFIERLGLAGLG